MKTALSFDDVLLVPGMSKVESRKDVDLSCHLRQDLDEDENYTDPGPEFRIPIISSPMDTVTGRDMIMVMHEAGGLGVGHRYCSIEEQVEMVKAEVTESKEENHVERHKRMFFDNHFSPRKDLQELRSTHEYQSQLKHILSHNAAAAIGVTGDYLERAQELVKANCKILCVDVAHGHHISVREALKNLKKKFGQDVILIAGNVATAKAFEDLSRWGADAIRVGIGGGSICSTRIQTGHGVPTLQSIIDCVESSGEAKIIADGGIRNSGDIVKAIAAGADLVMLGSLLAGTDESPGQVFSSAEGKKYKVYRGMASVEAQVDWRGEARSLEGVSTTIPYKGSVKKILKDLEQNIRSGMSYTGAEDLSELYYNSEMIRQTQAGMRESFTHILMK
tara:strand:+ start:734 stop:1906 length:1173 start_codon:yes stop_codon:yes gene_type:complete